MSFKAFLASPGRLGLLDYDEVELSNLHRQVLHGEENQGQAKALSAASAVQRYRLGTVLLLQSSVCMWTTANIYARNQRLEALLHAGKREGLKHSAVATKPPSFIPAQFKLLFFI